MVTEETEATGHWAGYEQKHLNLCSHHASFSQDPIEEETPRLLGQTSKLRMSRVEGMFGNKVQCM